MTFFEACMKEGIGPLLDLGVPNPQSPQQAEEWKKLGLKENVQQITWEFGPTAPYPFPPKHRTNDIPRTEIQKAREYMNNCVGEASRGRVTLASASAGDKKDAEAAFKKAVGVAGRMVMFSTIFSFGGGFC